MPKKKHSDVYAGKERKYMYGFQKHKDAILFPLVKLMIKLGISPNLLSYSTIILGLGFVYFIKQNLFISLWFLIAAMAFDTIDGSLARFSHKTPMSGSLVDEFSDQLVIVLTTIGFLIIGLIDGWVAILYVFAYTSLTALLVIRNMMNIPYKWVLRPRLIIYLIFFIFVIWGTNLLNYTMMLFSTQMIFQVFAGFFRIKEAV